MTFRDTIRDMRKSEIRGTHIRDLRYNEFEISTIRYITSEDVLYFHLAVPSSLLNS